MQIDLLNKYCMHTSSCGNLRLSDENKKVIVCGWIWRIRNLGGFCFLTLRDRTGIVQVVIDSKNLGQRQYDEISKYGREYVLKVEGVVKGRGEKDKNLEMPTGEIEIIANDVVLLNKSKTPPIDIEDNVSISDDMRLKWRFLDLRRPEMYKNLYLRHKLSHAIRNSLDKRGFLDIETPILANATPEGARDYVVPSRVNPGNFYALPQSPQQFKQLLMVAGVERYYQIARCFRDEDLRADRQPEFTQVDIEMSFVQNDDVMNTVEEIMQEVFSSLNIDIEFPLQKMQYKDAMENYGCDCPDIRYDMKIINLSNILSNCKFKVFSSTIKNGGQVKAINAKGAGNWSRGEVEKLSKIATDNGAKGMAFILFRNDGSITSPIKKFFDDTDMENIKSAMQADDGDLILFIADKFSICCSALSALRKHMAKKLELININEHKMLWVENFPMFSKDEETGKISAEHHPFTHVLDSDLDKLEIDPLSCGSNSYDLVMDGYEIGGGTIRIHNSEEQRKVLKVCGLNDSQIDMKFGHMLNALDLGAPPHGGIALGLDRFAMLISNREQIRDVIAFPKTTSASDLMTGAPNKITDSQLNELSIKVIK